MAQAIAFLFCLTLLLSYSLNLLLSYSLTLLLSYSLTLLHLEFQVFHRQFIVDQLPQRINPDFKMR